MLAEFQSYKGGEELGTHRFKKRARANGASSGWKKAKAPDAYVEKFIGTGTARCYWDCR